MHGSGKPRLYLRLVPTEHGRVGPVRPTTGHNGLRGRTMPAAFAATLAANEALDHRRRAGLPVLPLAFGEAGLPVMPELARELSAAAGHGSDGPVAGCPDRRGPAAGYWRRRGLPADPGLVVAGPGSKPL